MQPDVRSPIHFPFSAEVECHKVALQAGAPALRAQRDRRFVRGMDSLDSRDRLAPQGHDQGLAGPVDSLELRDAACLEIRNQQFPHHGAFQLTY